MAKSENSLTQLEVRSEMHLQVDALVPRIRFTLHFLLHREQITPQSLQL